MAMNRVAVFWVMVAAMITLFLLFGPLSIVNRPMSGDPSTPIAPSKSTRSVGVQTEGGDSPPPKVLTTEVPPTTESPPTPSPPPPEWKIVSKFSELGANLDEFLGRNKDPPSDASALCELLLLDIDNVCEMKLGKETFLECIERVGASRLEDVLPSRCTQSSWWQKRLEEEKAKGIVKGPKLTQRDPLWHAQVQEITKDAAGNVQLVRSRYIPAKERTHLAHQIESRKCHGGGSTVHPIQFGVPFRNIVPSVSRTKFFDFMPNPQRRFPPWRFAPGPYRMGHQDEYLSNQLHRYSYFHWTHKRGGWDCARHTEILAAGAVPYFGDITFCGKYCLPLLPKQLLQEVFELPGVSYLGSRGRNPNGEFMGDGDGNYNYNKPGRIQHDVFDKPKYFALADRLLNHTRMYLTTQAIVAYMLAKMGYEEPKKILLIGRSHFDYMETSIESGIADLGIPYVTNYERPMFKQVNSPNPDQPLTVKELENLRNARGLSSELHGAGQVYALRSPQMQFPPTHDTIIKGLKDKEFDMVIYMYWNMPPQQYPYWTEVKAAGIPKERIAFVNGNDDMAEPKTDWIVMAREGHMFHRELHDDQC